MRRWLRSHLGLKSRLSMHLVHQPAQTFAARCTHSVNAVDVEAPIGYEDMQQCTIPRCIQLGGSGAKSGLAGAVKRISRKRSSLQLSTGHLDSHMSPPSRYYAFYRAIYFATIVICGYICAPKKVSARKLTHLIPIHTPTKENKIMVHPNLYLSPLGPRSKKLSVPPTDGKPNQQADIRLQWRHVHSRNSPTIVAWVPR